MARADQFRLQTVAVLVEQLLQALFARIIRAQHDLFEDPERKRRPVREYLHGGLEGQDELALRFTQVGTSAADAQASALDADLIRQILICVMFGVEHPEDPGQKPEIREILLREVADVEQEVQVTDARSEDVAVENVRTGRAAGDQFAAERQDLTLQVAAREHRDLRDILRAVLLLLPGQKFRGLAADLRAALFGPAFLQGRHLPGHLGVVRLLQSLLGRRRDEDLVRIIQEILPQDPLVRPVVQPRLRLRKQLLVAKVLERRIVVVEPQADRVEADHQALREAAGVALAGRKLDSVQAGAQRVAVQALVREALERLAHHAQKIVLLSRVRAFRGQREIVLLQVLLHSAVDVRGDTRVQERLPQRGSRGLHERVLQDVERELQVRVAAVAAQEAHGQAALLVLVLLVRDRDLHLDLAHRRERLLRSDLRVRFDRIVIREILAVQPGQPLFHIAVSVQEDIAVRGMIITLMEREEILVSQRGNLIGVAAGLVGVGIVREQCLLHPALDHLVGVRERALHLVIDDAVDLQLAVRILQLIVPALLAEDLLLAVDVRMQDRVHVDVHKVREIAVVAACDGIDGLIRIGHRVQERVQRAFRELDERILRGELPRAAQHRVFQNVGQARAVRGRGAESDGEDLVFVVVRHRQHTCAALFMAQHRDVGAVFFDALIAQDLI